ncbi:hypothetical protein JUN65_08195 [Gluconacetobacter azotocaptans]|nr:hypothetical protein [Gluconacetobacter azotocaptans]
MPPAKNDYDWLGSGVYFWENDKKRATEWAELLKSLGKIKTPFVVGAVIDLGECLDLTVRENVELLRISFSDLEHRHQVAGIPLPENRSPEKRKEPDKLWRKLDCAVINNLCDKSKIKFETARALFVEGKPVYNGATFRELSHTQIAVRSSKNILGVFRVSGE